VAFTLGVLVIAISVALTLFKGDFTSDAIIYAFLRDVVMVAFLGFLVPINYTLFVKKRSVIELGLARKKWFASLIAGLLFAILLLAIFVNEAGQEGQEILLSADAFGPVFYLMLVGAFEIIFFYVFLRQQFEEAFGVVPGIVLAALFYSLHHAGFQPEFV
jgi:membrane protease YdiL (CAAX protease family)